MHKLLWGGAKFNGQYSREIILDDEIIGEINMDDYIDATVSDSMVGYCNYVKTEAILNPVIKIAASRLERKVTFVDFRRALNTGWIS